eukprot:scpid10587/ scgid16702/ SAM and SH3 domain-containing protein 1
MSAPPMPAARQARTGDDLEAKVRQKLSQDGLLDELSEEPYTMEDGETGPGFDDLCEYLPTELSCGADELRAALEAVRKSTLQQDTTKPPQQPKPISRGPKTASKSDLGGISKHDSPAASATAPKPGSKPAKPPPKAKAAVTARGETSPAAAAAAAVGAQAAGVEKDSAPATEEKKPAAPKPRGQKSTSSLASMHDESADPATGGPPKPHAAAKPPRQTSGIPASASAPNLSDLARKGAAKSNDNLYENSAPIIEEPSDSALYDNPLDPGSTTGSSTESVPVLKPRPAKLARNLGDGEGSKEAPVKSSRIAPPKPSRPVSMFSAVSPVDPGSLKALERSTSPEQKVVPNKPTRRGTSLEQGPGPAATPRKPVRDRAKTMMPTAGGAAPAPEPGQRAPVATPAATQEEDETEGMYETMKPGSGAVMSPTAVSKSSSDSGYTTPVGTDAEKPAEPDKPAEEQGDKGDAKAGKKSLTLGRFGKGKPKKKSVGDDEVLSPSARPPSMGSGAMTLGRVPTRTSAAEPQLVLPAPAARKEPLPQIPAAKPQQAGDWSAQDINLTAEQLIKIMQLVKQGKCTQEEAIQRMKEENRQKAQAAAQKDALTESANSHTTEDVGEDMDAVYEDPGEALQAAPVTMSPSSVSPTPTQDSTQEDEAHRDHADGDSAKDADKHAKGATLKGKGKFLGGFRKKKDASEDHQEVAEHHDDASKKKKGKFGGLFSKKTVDKDLKEDNLPSPTSPDQSFTKSDSAIDEEEEEGDMYATCGPSPGPSPTPNATIAGSDSVVAAAATAEDEAQAEKPPSPQAQSNSDSGAEEREDKFGGDNEAQITSSSSADCLSPEGLTDSLGSYTLVSLAEVPSQRAIDPFLPKTGPKSKPKGAPKKSVKRGSRTMLSGLRGALGKNRSSSVVKASDIEHQTECGDGPSSSSTTTDSPAPSPTSPTVTTTSPSPEIKVEEPPEFTGSFVAKAVVEMPYNPSPYDTESLRLKVDDVINVIEMAENGTWSGQLNGKIGKFKFIYVRVLDDETENADEKRPMTPPSTLSRTPAVAAPPMPKTLEEMFQQLNLPQYLKVFEENGYDDLSFFKDIDTTGALTEIGVTDTDHQEAILFMVDVLNAENKKRSGSLSKRSHRLSRIGMTVDAVFSATTSVGSDGIAESGASEPGVAPDRPQPRQRAATATAAAAAAPVPVPSKPSRNAPPRAAATHPAVDESSAVKSDAPSSRTLSVSPEPGTAENPAASPKRPKPQGPAVTAFAAQLESNLKANQTGKEKGAALPGVQRRSTFGVRSSNTSDSKQIAKQAVAKRRSLEEGDVSEEAPKPLDVPQEGKSENKKRRAPAPPQTDGKADSADDQGAVKSRERASSKPKPIPEEGATVAELKQVLSPIKVMPMPKDQPDGKAHQETSEKPEKPTQRGVPPPRPASSAVGKLQPQDDAPTSTTPKANRAAPKLPTAGASTNTVKSGENSQAGETGQTGQSEESKKHMDTIKQKLASDDIKLSAAPYSLRSGSGGIPAGLVQRLAMDTRIAITNVAPALEKLRQESLTAAKRKMIPCKPVLTSGDEWMTLARKTCLYEWLHSIGLPMYNTTMAEAGCDLATVKEVTEEEMREMGIANILHAKRILRAASALQL